MAQSVEELFTEVRKLFREIGNSIVQLAGIEHSDIADNSAVLSLIDEFRPVFDQTKERLDHPTLSIATLGTTSSGKSTIVNALIGRKIAPILNDEMSGGVLRIKSGEQSVLISNPNPITSSSSISPPKAGPSPPPPKPNSSSNMATSKTHKTSSAKPSPNSKTMPKTGAAPSSTIHAPNSTPPNASPPPSSNPTSPPSASIASSAFPPLIKT
ncbi:dynamin family protein [Spirulina subsalsa FACHB-351]|uniref:Dynamin family protein n=1 Tax=Spirulina subsalsa FACHB-351 TaxID=234711 RepID=A0ABT3L6L9_9CYAN|nr:dynamin family protein [Spirulina subsalsa]MCW6037144.1 dynamin family protein [Spirulina subsalsa FACHB-351]